MQGAVDGDDVALGEHLLEILDAAAANLLLLLGRQGLVVVVQQLLAVEGLEAAQDTLADAADGDGADDLALEVELVLGGGGDVPVAGLDLLVGGDEVADEDEDGHDDVLGDGDDVGAGDLGDGDAAVGLVGGIEVDVVGADTSGDGDLEVLGLGEALSGQVAGVEAVVVCPLLALLTPFVSGGLLHVRAGASRVGCGRDSRSGDDDLGVDELLVEGRVLALLVRSGDQRVALVLEPLAQTKLVLSGAKQTGNLRVVEKSGLAFLLDLARGRFGGGGRCQATGSPPREAEISPQTPPQQLQPTPLRAAASVPVSS